MIEILGLTPSQWLVPILIGVVAGFVTNAVAIWMLFHPYRPIYLGRVRVMPMGAIPKEIDRIARRIGETVGKELLTPDDIGRTLSSDAFRERFDDALRGAVRSLLEREIGPLREIVPADQADGLQAALDLVLDKLLDGIGLYLASPEWETRVRGFAAALADEFRDRPLSVALTPQLQEDLLQAFSRVWEGVRESPEFQRVISEALERGIGNLLVSEKPLREYVPMGAVNFGETFVAHYLPLLLERLGEALEDPVTRSRLQDALRRFTDRFLDEQRTWKRIVGRLVITERTLAQTVDAIEQGGVDEISALLREPEVQERVARAVNQGLEDLLDKPLKQLLGSVTPERAERLRNVLVERILYLFRHSTTEDVIRRRLEGLLDKTREKTVGDLFHLLGEERGRELTDRLAAWVVERSRGPRTIEVLRRIASHQTSWMMSVPIGRLARYLPADAERRAEDLLFDPLWGFIQRKVPAAVAGLPVAKMVEDKLKAYPIQKVEELIWRVSKRELVLIIYLGGFLGALVGSAMLFTLSPAAGAAATGFFLVISFLFINLKA